MLCEGCSKNKLRKEFPPCNICEEEHALVHCIRCVIESVEKRRLCPTCKTSVSKSSTKYIACRQKLQWLFPPFEVDEGACGNASDITHGLSLSNICVEVVMLNGDKNTIMVSRSETVNDFREKIAKKFGVEARKQRLLYNDKPMETYKSDRLMRLSDYKLTNNSTITLIKVLKTISASLKHVTFDFSWEYVGYQRDFLNASALVYSGSSLKDYVEFRPGNTTGALGYLDSYGPYSVTHSGHGFKYNRRGKRGNHVIRVNLEMLPSSIDKVFFTLSALNAESIHDFIRLQLNFYDSRNPSEQLCSDQISRAVDDKAVVFCCLCRIDGCWQVFSLQEPSGGNVRYYQPLFNTVQQLIFKGFS